MGEFDVPLVLCDEFFGEVCCAGTRFDGSGDITALAEEFSFFFDFFPYISFFRS
jgi:hypothetical protein